MTSESFDDIRRKRTWRSKFLDSFRGIKRGVRGQTSFFVHGFAALAAIVAGLVLKVHRLEWQLIALCIALVFACEMFNTALESLAKAIDQRSNPRLRDALDMSSGAVLIASIGAAAVGLSIFGHRLWAMLRGEG